MPSGIVCGPKERVGIPESWALLAATSQSTRELAPGSLRLVLLPPISPFLFFFCG